MSICSEARRAERGSVLLEALIGVVLTGIIAAGTAHISARVAVGHHELRVQGMAVAQMREALNAGGAALCGTTGQVVLADGATANMAVACAPAPVITVTPAPDARYTVPASLTVVGVPVVSASVRLQAMGVKAEADTAAIVVGTQQ